MTPAVPRLLAKTLGTQRDADRGRPEVAVCMRVPRGSAATANRARRCRHAWLSFGGLGLEKVGFDNSLISLAFE